MNRMAVCFYDRFSEREFMQPDGELIVGRWRVSVKGPGKVKLNAVDVLDGDFLVCDASNNWRVTPHGDEGLSGSIPKNQVPDDIDTNSIRSIGNLIIEKQRGWNDWMAVVPLDPGLSDKIKITAFERDIEKFLGALETVCMKPYTHLFVEDERVVVSRAKRIPAGASPYLASHTEDWERRMIWGVQPKKILSEVRCEQVNIYENRVAAKLVDHLVFYLSKRINEINKALKVIQDSKDHSSSIQGGTHWRMGRIMKLWGERLDSDGARKTAIDTLEFVKGQYYRLMGLMDSPLYIEIPRFSFENSGLRMTNILANDQNYRRVALLWKAWADNHKDRKLSTVERYRETQAVCQGMDRFGMLLIIRALGQMKYSLSSGCKDQTIQCGGRWDLRWNEQHVVLEWNAKGMIHIKYLDRRLTFISIPLDFGAVHTEDQKRTLIDGFRKFSTNEGDVKIVLYCGSEDPDQKKASNSFRKYFYTVGNDPRVSDNKHIGFLPVSPWDIGSVERVARAIRWFLDSQRLKEYPHKIAMSSVLADRFDLDRHDWIDFGKNHQQVSFRRPPEDYEWDRLDIKGRLNKIQKEYDAAVADYEGISQALRYAARNGKIGDLNQQKKNKEYEAKTLKKQLDDMKVIEREFNANRPKSLSLRVCPVCGHSNNTKTHFESLDHDCFRCHCSGCKARWGLLKCTNDHRFPFLMPNKDFVLVSDRDVGWEDRIYGSDLLSLPDSNSNEERGFVCPDCGDIIRVNYRG